MLKRTVIITAAFMGAIIVNATQQPGSAGGITKGKAVSTCSQFTCHASQVNVGDTTTTSTGSCPFYNTKDPY